VQKPCLCCYIPSLDQLTPASKFRHLAPTVRATKKPPAMAPKKASSKADEAAKAALLAAKKGKALALPTPPTKRLLKTMFSAPAKTTLSAPAKTMLSAPAALRDSRNLPRLRSTRGHGLHRGRRSHRCLRRRTATAACPAHQEPQSPEAKRDT
jgi:hypothetical protein